MRTTICVVLIAVSMLFVSATVWEGVTDVTAATDNPGNYSVATNAFPRNSIVDITNLENGKRVRVQVVSGLDTNGLLATLSRNAAGAIALRDTFTCRIRMTLPPDDIAFANFRLGPIDLSDNDALLADNSVPAETTENEAVFAAAEPYNNMGEDMPAIDEPYNYLLEDDVYTGIASAEAPVTETVAAEPLTDAELVASILSETEEPAEPVFAETAPLIEVVPAEQMATAAPRPRMGEGSGIRISIIPSEERIPVLPGAAIAPEDIASPIPHKQAATPPVAVSKAASVPAYTAPAEFSPFPVPLISRLEKGKWYVQIAVYNRADHVEDEVGRIGHGYPLAVQNVGTDANPLFRILLGPLNQGESEAMLQRFKSIGYNDAFVRYN